MESFRPHHCHFTDPIRAYLEVTTSKTRYRNRELTSLVFVPSFPDAVDF